MGNSSFRVGRNGKKTVDHRMQRINPKRMIIQTRDEAVVLPASGKKDFAAAHPNLFKRLKAIGDECGTDDAQAFDSDGGQTLQFVFSVRLEPRVFSEARLKSYGMARDPTFAEEGADCCEALGAVTRL